jgi:tRNA-Thr(GGU) m(6)t(6)A37 methyltransferase TsaA
MKSCNFSLRPIGVIRTPFNGVDDQVPIQGRLSPETQGEIHIYPEFIDGLKDIDGFSHIILFYIFHKTAVMKLRARPYMDSVIRGIFSIRSPHRPNRIGMTIVQLLTVDDGVLKISGVDMVDGTPLVDIKPYNPRFDGIDQNEPIRTGWMEKPVEKDGNRRITIDSRKQWLHEQDT